MQNFLTQKVLPLIAPQSLAIDRQTLTKEEVAAAKRLKVNELTQPGDLILIRTPGNFYELFRVLTANPYDHVAVVVNNNMCLHVGPPRARLLQVERLLIPSRQPLLLRPRLTEAERAAFVSACERFVGTEYDIPRVYHFMVRLGLSRYLRVKHPFAFGNVAHVHAQPLSPIASSSTTTAASDKSIPPSSGSLTSPSSPSSPSSSSAPSSLSTSPSNSSQVQQQQQQQQQQPQQQQDLKWICSDAVMWLLLAHARELRSAAHAISLTTTTAAEIQQESDTPVTFPNPQSSMTQKLQQRQQAARQQVTSLTQDLGQRVSAFRDKVASRWQRAYSAFSTSAQSFSTSLSSSLPSSSKSSSSASSSSSSPSSSSSLATASATLSSSLSSSSSTVKSALTNHSQTLQQRLRQGWLQMLSNMEKYQQTWENSFKAKSSTPSSSSSFTNSSSSISTTLASPSSLPANFQSLKSRLVSRFHNLDYPIYGSSSLNDFLTLHHRRPDLLVHIPIYSASVLPTNSFAFSSSTSSSKSSSSSSSPISSSALPSTSASISSPSNVQGSSALASLLHLSDQTLFTLARSARFILLTIHDTNQMLLSLTELIKIHLPPSLADALTVMELMMMARFAWHAGHWMMMLANHHDQSYQGQAVNIKSKSSSPTKASTWQRIFFRSKM